MEKDDNAKNILKVFKQMGSGIEEGVKEKILSYRDRIISAKKNGDTNESKSVRESFENLTHLHWDEEWEKSGGERDLIRALMKSRALFDAIKKNDTTENSGQVSRETIGKIYQIIAEYNQKKSEGEVPGYYDSSGNLLEVVHVNKETGNLVVIFQDSEGTSRVAAISNGDLSKLREKYSLSEAPNRNLKPGNPKKVDANVSEKNAKALKLKEEREGFLRRYPGKQKWILKDDPKRGLSWDSDSVQEEDGENVIEIHYIEEVEKGKWLLGWTSNKKEGLPNKKVTLENLEKIIQKFKPASEPEPKPVPEPGKPDPGEAPDPDKKPEPDLKNPNPEPDPEPASKPEPEPTPEPGEPGDEPKKDAELGGEMRELQIKLAELEEDERKLQIELAGLEEEERELEREEGGEFMSELTELEEAEKAVEDARKEYLRAHYEMEKRTSRLRKMFSFLKTGSDDIPDVKSAHGKYKESVNNILNLQIEDIKKRKADGEIDEATMKEEMGNMAVFYKKKENINLISARTEVEAEGKGIWKSFKKGAACVINGYRELPLSAKLAIGGAFFVAGLAGLAGTSAVAGLVVLRRALGSASTGVGAAAMAEALQRASQSRKAGKEKEAFIKELESAKEGEDIFEKLRAKVAEDINQSDKILEKEIKSAKNRKLLGVAVAGVCFVLPGIVGTAKHWLGFGGVHAPAVSSGTPNAESAASALKEAGNSVQAGGEAAVNEAAHQTTGLTVGEGSNSIEGTIIKQLTDDQIDKTKVGGIAHRLALNYARDNKIPFEKLNLVEKGLHFDLERVPVSAEYPDGLKITNLEGKFGWNVDHHPSGASHHIGADHPSGAGVKGTDIKLGPSISADELGLESDADLVGQDVPSVETPSPAAPNVPSGESLLQSWEGGHRADIKDAGNLLDKWQGLKEASSFKGIDPTDQEAMKKAMEASSNLSSSRYFAEKALGKILPSLFEGNTSGISNLATANSLDAGAFLGASSPDQAVLRIGALAKEVDIKPKYGEKLGDFVTRLVIETAKKGR